MTTLLSGLAFHFPMRKMPGMRGGGSRRTSKGQKWLLVPTAPEADVLPQAAPLRWAAYMLAQSPGSLARFRAAKQVEQLDENPPLVVVRSRAGRSVRQLKQLGLGALQSLQDWDLRYAFDGELVEDALGPYLRDEKLWIIPDSQEHYAFNQRLAGKALAQMRDPASTILFYEGRDEKPVFRYEGKAAVCLVDGHAKLVDAKELEDLQWEP